MPKANTLLGGSAGGGIALLQPHVQVVMDAWVSGQWTPEALQSKATIYSTAAMALLGVALSARDSLRRKIAGEEEQEQPGEPGFLRRWLLPEVKRVRVTPDDPGKTGEQP
jgi:hypothetical protein